MRHTQKLHPVHPAPNFSREGLTRIQLFVLQNLRFEVGFHLDVLRAVSRRLLGQLVRVTQFAELLHARVALLHVAFDVAVKLYLLPTH